MTPIIQTITPIKIFRLPDGTLSRSPDCLEYQLRSLKAQTGDIVIRSLISDMTEDKEIQKKIKKIATRYGATYIHSKCDLLWNKALCLNIGIRAAAEDCDFIATLDADLIYRDSVFASCVRASRAGKSKSVVICRTFMYNRDTWEAGFTAGEFNRVRSKGKFLTKAGNGGIQFFPREWLHKVRGYDERYNLWGGPDNEIVNRARMDGLRVHWISMREDEIHLIHLKHPQWIINGTTHVEIGNYRKKVNHKLYRQKAKIIANDSGWGDPKMAIGPTSGADLRRLEEQVKATEVVNRTRPAEKVVSRLKKQEKTRYKIIVTTYRRSNQLRRLLEDLSSYTQNYDLQIEIFEDFSDQTGAKVVEEYRKRLNILYHPMAAHHGKQKFWSIHNEIQRRLRRHPARDLIVFLQDDIRLAENFFSRIQELWNALPTTNRTTLNLFLDKDREGKACWTGVTPKLIKTEAGKAYHTQWVDLCAFVCDAQFGQLLNHRIRSIPANRWRNNEGLSSGVAEQISKKLHRAGGQMYQVHSSFVYHGEHQSLMNPIAREQMKLKTQRYVGTRRIEPVKSTLPYYVRQITDFGIGNFINCTPAIKALSDHFKAPVPVFFELDHVKRMFLDCPFISIVEHERELGHRKEVFNSGLINRNVPDWKYIHQKVGEQFKLSGKKKLPHTYVDPCEFTAMPNQPYVVFARGMVNDTWAERKDPGDEIYQYMVRKVESKGYRVVFIGARSDYERSLERMGSWVVNPLFVLDDVRESLGAIRGSEMMIANDTGMYHAAGALNHPIFVLWKDTLFEKNKSPGKGCKFSHKRNWRKDFDRWLEERTLQFADKAS